MPNPPSTTAFAEVRAHDQVMRYRRAGAGRPLLVLRSALDPDSLWPELEASLTGAFRVLTPEVPAGCGDVASWLGGFMEGVGLDRVALLAADGCCLSALELALLGSDRVERLVLVPAGNAGETGLDGTLATSLDGIAIPLLVVRRGLPADEAIPLLTQFLESRNATSPAG
jgi:pimeloyl-ACP methyl ester carboxylesterase